jgi:GEVED domain
LKLKIFGISTIVFFAILSFAMYKRNIENVSYDRGDAPNSYGKAIHYKPEIGPFFGKLRGDNDASFGGRLDLANMDDSVGANDEDAFEHNFSIFKDNKTYSCFLADIEANENSYILKIPVSNAEDGDPVKGWIDFDGNGKFDPYESVSSTCRAGSSIVQLTWTLPENLKPAITYARFRTCRKVYEEQINEADTKTTSGEVEDYIVRIIKPSKNSSELKNYIDFSVLPHTDNIDSTREVLKKLKIGDIDVSFQFSGSYMDVLGVNNFHEASLFGVRLGHNSLDATPQNPIATKMTFSKPVENLTFKLTDLDGGDRIKIVGYDKGAVVNCNIKNITENFYYNYDLKKQEIYGRSDFDAGNDPIIPSSLDMGIEVSFLGFIDSVNLFYSDGELGSSGTVTICDVNCRKMNVPPFKMNAFSATEEDRNIVIKWIYSNTDYAKSYALERSFDGIEYTILAKGDCNPTTLIYNYIDAEIPIGQSSCYYRVSTIEVDNHESYSSPTRLKRKQASGISGFVFPNQTFSTEMPMELLLDFPGKSDMIIYDYTGKIVKKLAFENLRVEQKITIKNLNDLDVGTYYFELLYNNQKFLVSGFKNDTAIVK